MAGSAGREDRARPQAAAAGGEVGPVAAARTSRHGHEAGSGRAATIVPLAQDACELAARRLRTLGHPLRLQLLEVLAAGPRSVTDLARVLGVEHYLVSKHLIELLRCDVVVRRQEGSFAVYSLPNALTIKASHSCAAASSRIGSVSPGWATLGHGERSSPKRPARTHWPSAVARREERRFADAQRRGIGAQSSRSGWAPVVGSSSVEPADPDRAPA